MKRASRRMPFFVKILKYSFLSAILYAVKADSTRVYNLCYHYGADEYAPQ
jgi:hypothetical protein